MHYSDDRPSKLPPDGVALSGWLRAMLASGRGPRQLTKLVDRLRANGLADASYPTLSKARAAEALLPPKYAQALAATYDLTREERARFFHALALAHLDRRAAEMGRIALGLPDVIDVPDLRARPTTDATES